MNFRAGQRVIGGLFLAGALHAAAQVPSLINYQGRLLAGTNLVNSSVSMVLRLYTNATSGACLYEDSNTVTVVDGLYATFIGDNTTFGSLTNALASGDAFVEVTVNGSTLMPRERIASVGYAVVAAHVQPGSIDLSSLDTNSVDAQYVNVAGDAMTGSLVLPPDGLTVGTNQLVVVGGSVGIGTNNPSSRLDVVGGPAAGDFIMKLYSGSNLVGWARKK